MEKQGHRLLVHMVLAERHNTGSRGEGKLLPARESSIAWTSMSILAIRPVAMLGVTVAVIPVIALWTVSSIVVPVIWTTMVVWTMIMAAASH